MRTEIIDGKIVSVRRLQSIGGSFAITIPRYILRNLTISLLDTPLYAAIEEQPDGVRIRFYSQEKLEELLIDCEIEKADDDEQ